MGGGASPIWLISGPFLASRRGHLLHAEFRKLTSLATRGTADEPTLRLPDRQGKDPLGANQGTLLAGRCVPRNLSVPLIVVAPPEAVVAEVMALDVII